MCNSQVKPCSPSLLEAHGRLGLTCLKGAAIEEKVKWQSLNGESAATDHATQISRPQGADLHWQKNLGVSVYYLSVEATDGYWQATAQQADQHSSAAEEADRFKKIQKTENENSKYTHHKWDAMSASINFSIIHGHAGIPFNLLLKSLGWNGLFLQCKLLSPHNSIKASEACPRKLDIATNQHHSAAQMLAALSVHPECNWKLFTGKWLLITHHKVSLWHISKRRAPYSWRQCWPEGWSCWSPFCSKLAAEATIREGGDTRRTSREPRVNRQISLGTRWWWGPALWEGRRKQEQDLGFETEIPQPARRGRYTTSPVLQPHPEQSVGTSAEMGLRAGPRHWQSSDPLLNLLLVFQTCHCYRQHWEGAGFAPSLLGEDKLSLEPQG